MILMSNKTIAQFNYDIKKIATTIEIDGKDNEPIWNTLPTINNFIQSYPTDTAKAQNPTVVKLCYDKKFIYLYAFLKDTVQKPLVVQSLKRDFSIKNSDAFVFSLSPLNDNINGFSFGVNALGAQREGLIAQGGGFGVTTAWDNTWYSEVAKQKDGWSVEMKIPFKTLRFKKNSNDWGINFSRVDVKNNETTNWIPIPRNFNISNLGFVGKMHFEESPIRNGANIVLIPYVTGGASYNYLRAPYPSIHNLANVGFDTKVGITSSLNLDITVNPDFSQVEVDDQVVNLDRFELFFPERRQFFIENNDLFEGFGFSKIRPFFSRRIGLYRGEQVPIIAGTRLSGSINKNWRIGIMDMLTNKKETQNLPMQNYVVAAVQRRVFDRSNIGMILLSKQGFDKNESIKDQTNTLIGIDYNLYSKDNKWRGKFFYHHSFNNKVQIDANANATWLAYVTSKWNIQWNHEYVGKFYNAEVGFVPRTAYFRLEPSISYIYYPKKNKKIFSWTNTLYYSQYWSTEFKNSTDRTNRYSTDILLLNTSHFIFNISNIQTRLVRDFDVSGRKYYPIKAGNYTYTNASLSYTSDIRKKLTYSANINGGKYFDRYSFSYGAGIAYRFQPYGSISANITRNEFYKNGDNISLTLLSSKLEITFSKNLFFNNIVQYNTQQNVFNLNTRLQWRFKPMSDLFIVYTDIYDNLLAKRQRAFQIKFTYWFQL